MALRSFGLDLDIYNRSVALPPDANGTLLLVAQDYYNPTISLWNPWSGGVWATDLGPFWYGGGVSTGVGVVSLRGVNAGDILAWWGAGQPGGGSTLEAEVLDSSGHVLAGRFQLSSETQGNQYGQVLALADGGFEVVFTEDANAANTVLESTAYPPYVNTVWVQEGFDLATRTFGADFTATGPDAVQSAVNDQWQVSATPLRNGGFALAYSDTRYFNVSPDSTQDYAIEVRVQLLDASGAVTGNLLVEIENGPSLGFRNPPWGTWSYTLPHAQPSVFATAQGFGVLWESNGSVVYGASSGDQIQVLHLALFNGAGTQIGTDITLRSDLASVNYDAFFHDYHYAGVQLANGHIVVASSINLAGGREVFLQEYSASGSAIGGAVQVTSDAGNHDLAALYLDQDGHVVVGVIEPDGHQDLLTFSEAQESATVTFGDGSYATTTRGITGHAWSTTVADYTAGGVLFQETFTDQWGNLWQDFHLLGAVDLTTSYDGAGHSLHSDATAANAGLGDGDFATLSGLAQLYLRGAGAQSVTLGADAEAAFTGGLLKLRDPGAADSFTVDATALSNHATLDLFADSGVAHFTLGAENDTVYFNAATWAAAGRTVDGGGGYNNIDLTFTGTVADADFTGITHLNELDLVGASAASIILGAQAAAAFGTNTVKVAAENSAVIKVDGHALNAGFFAEGAGGADTFIGGAGNDSFYGLGGADLFILGQGGHDRIYDFAHGTDRIDLSAAGVHSLAEIAMRENGTEAVLTFAGQELRLNNVDYHQLSAGDFIFSAGRFVLG